MVSTGNKDYLFAKDSQRRGQKTQETADLKEATHLHRQGGGRGPSLYPLVETVG